MRLRRRLSRRRLHHRAEGDSENLGSSRRKKKRLALATRALATGFTPRHLSDTPTPDGRSVSSRPNSPGARHFSTALHRLLELCYPHQDSLGLHSPILVGKFRADRGRRGMKFPILLILGTAKSVGCRFRRARWLTGRSDGSARRSVGVLLGGDGMSEALLRVQIVRVVERVLSIMRGGDVCFDVPTSYSRPPNVLLSCGRLR